MDLLIEIVLAVLLFALTLPLSRRRRDQRKFTNPDVIPINLNFSPYPLMRHAIAANPQFGPLAIDRNRETERLYREIEELETELDLARQAQVELAQLDQEADQRVAPAVRPIHFKPNEPQTFDQYVGQKQVIKPLRAAVMALAPDRLVIDHKAFVGPAGLGKTTIAKVTANELDQRAQRLGLGRVPLYETYAVNLNSIEDMDRTARELLQAGGGLWFIDELHVLTHEMSTKIFLLMEEGRYPFKGDMQPTPIPNVCVMGATTDWGSTHEALRRRFGEPMRLRPMAKDELFSVIAKRGMPMQDGAAQLLVEHTHWSGAPWEALVMRREAEIFAVANGHQLVTEADVQEVFDTYEIDAMGLRNTDRDVLRALFTRPNYRGKEREFVCYGASEADLCQLARLDPEEYRTDVKPRLMSRGLVEVRKGYGQALTERAVALYTTLKQE